MEPNSSEVKTTEARVNGAPQKASRMTKLTRWSRRPLVVLVIASMVSVYLIPRIIAQADEDKALHAARLKLAYEFSERNTEFNSKNNAIATLMETFHRQVQLDPGGLKGYQSEFRRDWLARRMALDEMAWWWYGNLELRASSLKLTAKKSEQLQQDFGLYGESVVKTVNCLNDLADYLRSPELAVDPKGEAKYAALWKKMWDEKSKEHKFRKNLVASISSSLAKD